MAEEDLKAADRLHLATATNAALIAVNATLKGALADMIRLHYERGIMDHPDQQDHVNPT